MKANKTIRWKIINKNTRTSLCTKIPILERYYPLFRIIEAHPKTIGLMCYESKKDAEKFIEKNNWQNLALIIKVQTFGKGKKPKYVLNVFCDEIEVFDWYLSYLKGLDYDSRDIPAPEGTICYPAVMPLE